MVWTEGKNDGFSEANKIAHLIVPYTRGHVLELGVGTKKTFSHFTAVDSCQATQGYRSEAVSVVQDARNLYLFGNESWDSVFSSHLLEHFSKTDVVSALKEWARVLRPHGFLVLYVPSANLYPKAGTPGANEDHKTDIYPGDVERWLQSCTSCGWTQLEKEERDSGDEYSHFLVFQKRTDGKFVEKLWQRNPGGKKRALIIRFGAIGDLLQTTSLLDGLKSKGLHITWMGHANTISVVRQDPRIDEFLLQDQDQVPNGELGPYWASLRERYDQIINLCESVEGGLLAMPGKLQHEYGHEARDRIYGVVNYLDRMADIAEVPCGGRVKFYPTEQERAWAAKERARTAGPVIIWCLTGTSHHKTYPFVQVVARWLLEQTPARLYLYGDKYVAKPLQDAIIACLEADKVDTSMVQGICGVWSIRESLAFAQVADIVIGPETGVMNAVCHEETVAKVIYLSHSSKINLTRDWLSTTTLTPAAEACPCYPCHQLHYDFTFCPQVESTKAALCASAISPADIFKACMDILLKKAKEAA